MAGSFTAVIIVAEAASANVVVVILVGFVVAPTSASIVISLEVIRNSSNT